MGHTHAQPGATRRRLCIALATTACTCLVQALGAVFTGSLALLADAGHLVSDLAGLIVALVAVTIAAHPATDRNTFGFHRFEVFGALVNGLILIGTAVGVLIGSLTRVTDGHHQAHGAGMLGVAILGLVGNLVALYTLRSGARDSLNVRGAYLEILGDAMGSVLVILGAVVILGTGWGLADTMVSLIIAVILVPRAGLLLRDVFAVLSESAPRDADVAEIRRHVLETPGVVDVHDVHVWQITTGNVVFSAHVVVEPESLTPEHSGPLLATLTTCLNDHFDVSHSTFQLEPTDHAQREVGLHR